MLWLASLALLTAPNPLDPMLPDHLRPVVERASAAELDSGRGAANAVRLLQEAQRGRPEDQLRLQLRVAAISLRQTFLTKSKLDVPGRYGQALATFSRLDVTEPGFSAWLERTLKHRPDAERSLSEDPKIRVAVLIRGKVVDRATLKSELRTAFADLKRRAQLTFVAPKDADYRLELGAQTMTRPGERPTIEFVAEVQAKDGWESRLRRAIEADEPSVAARAGARWAARIAGRDLAAKHLAAHGLAYMIAGPSVLGIPGTTPHDHHDH